MPFHITCRLCKLTPAAYAADWRYSFMLTVEELRQVALLLMRDCTFREIRQTYSIGMGALSRMKGEINSRCLTGDQLESMDADSLCSLAYLGRAPYGQQEKAEPNFEKAYQRLSNRKLHATLKQEWQRYITENPDGYRYSQFCFLYGKWEQEHHPGRAATAPIYRNPGEFLYIDWVGDVIEMVHNPKNPDKPFKAHFFVTTLGRSSLTFACAFPDEKSHSVIEGINRALQFYGALPRYFRPDNMKTAVIENSTDRLILSAAMKEIESYYQTPVLPTRPRAPKDKSTCERAVGIIESEFIAPVSGRLFGSFDELNEELAGYLDVLNNRIKKPGNKSRLEIFKEEDLPAMRTLPSTLLTPMDLVRRKVPKDCHVQYDGHYYSVPFTLTGQDVLLKITRFKVIISDLKNKDVADHNRSYKESKRYITDPNHLKSSYRVYHEESKQDSEYFLKEAERIGPNMKELIDRILKRSEFPESEYRTCRGVLHTGSRYSNVIRNEAAQRCIERYEIGYKNYRKYLREVVKEQGDSTGAGNLSSHGNIRGGDYYQ